LRRGHSTLIPQPILNSVYWHEVSQCLLYIMSYYIIIIIHTVYWHEYWNIHIHIYAYIHIDRYTIYWHDVSQYMYYTKYIIHRADWHVDDDGVYIYIYICIV